MSVERSYLDAFLSVNFNECNIAAANTAELAHKLMQEGTLLDGVHTETLAVPHLVGDDVSLDTFDVYSLKIPTAKSDIAEGDKGKAYIRNAARTLNVEHTVLCSSEVRLVLMRSHAVPDASPTLAAIYNEDMAVPIASFEQRVDGQCSYVQIGPELDEDDLVVTSNAPRSNYVEAIRSLFEFNAAIKQTELSPLCIELVHDALDRHRIAIEQGTASAAARLATRRFAELATIGSELSKRLLLTVLNDGDGKPEFYDVSELSLHPYDVTDNLYDTLNGRRVRMALARKLVMAPVRRIVKKGWFSRQQIDESEVLQPTDGIDLLAITRAGVALKLAHLSENGTSTLDSYDKPMDPEAARTIIATLNDELTTMALPKKVKKFALGSNYGLLFSDIKDLLDSINLPLDWERRTEHLNDIDKMISEVVAAVKPRHRELTSMVSGGYAWPIGRLLALTQAGEQFDKYLGNAASPSEQIITALSKVAMGSNTYRGILNDMPIGKTRGDVDATFKITTEGPAYTVTMWVRPKALVGMQPVVAFNESIRADAFNPDTKQRLAEIAHTIGQVCIPANRIHQ
jgi:hypothetical protein